MNEARSNIILLTIDCLRADHLGCMGYERPVTPFMDRLARKGILFKSAYANGPGTALAFKSIFCSVYPTQIAGLGLPLDYPPTLAELLKSVGYSTCGFNTNGNLSGAFHYDRGFGLFYDLDAWSRSLLDRVNIEIKRLWRDIKGNRFLGGFRRLWEERASTVWRSFEFLYRGLFAGEMTEKALACIKKQTEPFFAWVHLMDVHHPYIIRDRYSPNIKQNKLSSLREGNFAQNELEELVDLYDDQISHVDALIEKFLNEILEFGKKRTICIVTADHGEQFLEHGGFHAVAPYQEMIHVPLMMTGGSLPQGVEVSTPVSHLDLLPTVMDLVGHHAGGWCEGESLLPYLSRGKEERAVLVSYSDVRALVGRMNKLVRRMGSNSWEFYDLASDPSERDNIFDEEDVVQRGMIDEMEKRERLIKRKPSYVAGKSNVSDYVKKQLKALGYID